jgi:hypothetical protein
MCTDLSHGRRFHEEPTPTIFAKRSPPLPPSPNAMSQTGNAHKQNKRETTADGAFGIDAVTRFC